jgi:N-methylhydantoinase A/oxoprolinase/acetone carboxylase beta subunit
MTMRLSAFADTPTISLPELSSGPLEVQSEMRSHVHGNGEVPQYKRTHLHPGCAISGPALVVEETATLWMPGGWGLTASDHGHLLLERDAHR